MWCCTLGAWHARIALIMHIEALFYIGYWDLCVDEFPIWILAPWRCRNRYVVTPALKSSSAIHSGIMCG